MADISANLKFVFNGTSASLYAGGDTNQTEFTVVFTGGIQVISRTADNTSNNYHNYAKSLVLSAYAIKQGKTNESTLTTTDYDLICHKKVDIPIGYNGTVGVDATYGLKPTKTMVTEFSAKNTSSKKFITTKTTGASWDNTATDMTLGKFTGYVADDYFGGSGWVLLYVAAYGYDNGFLGGDGMCFEYGIDGVNTPTGGNELPAFKLNIQRGNNDNNYTAKFNTEASTALHNNII